MGLQLFVTAGPDKGRAFPVSPGDMLLVGRSKATETRLVDPHVSKVHCRVEWTRKGVLVTDQESTGGTYVNGRRVTEQLINPGDVLRIGQTELRLFDEDAPEEDVEEKTLAGFPAATVRPAAPASGPLEELTGKTLSHYLVGPVVARARTGVVFEAQDTRTNRKVAVKVLMPDLVSNDEEVQRFVRAMRTVLPLRHPNLVAVYGAGKSGTYCWSAMEYVAGESLAQVMARRGKDGVLDWRPALRYAVHVARALDYLHHGAIVHRNVTPRNVLVRGADQVAKLGDVMLAKALEGMMVEKITRQGDIVGDVHYRAPEHAGGEDGDARSDLYSLGSLTYAVLTGRPPFEGTSAVETLIMIRQADPVKPTHYQPAIPPRLEAAVTKLLQKAPAKRYATAAELIKELEAIAGSHGVAL
jgi:serine/threonine protein kinase